MSGAKLREVLLRLFYMGAPDAGAGAQAGSIGVGQELMALLTLPADSTKGIATVKGCVSAAAEAPELPRG